SPSPMGGPYALRDIRNLYPTVTERHLRYLEKWGLLRQPAGGIVPREYSFADLQTVKHVAAELDRGTPLRVILRAVLAERDGQLQLDFHAGDSPRPKVVSLDAHKPPRKESGPTHRDLAELPYADSQADLAAKYFGEGSLLDDGDEQKMPDAAAAY